MNSQNLSQDLQVQYRPIAALHPNARNPRTHSPAQLRQIADSIRQFGFVNPVLVDEEDHVLAGHGRLEAARAIGMAEVPTIRLEQMTEADKRAYILADNKIAQKAGWDQELLALELQYLTDLDLDFDVTITGFEMAEIDILIQGLDEDDADEENAAGNAAGGIGVPDPADEIPDGDPDDQVISLVGDLFELGAHRLLCADATQVESYAALMAGERAQLVFADPPYNVPITGHVSGLGQVQHREFPMASGEMTPGEFTEFLHTVFRHLAAHSQDGAIHYVCMDWRHLGEVLAAGASVFTELKNLCVWAKTNAGMGSLYRSQHELIFVFKSGTAPHVNNVELGKHGRYRTNVWRYPGANTFRSGREDELALHPTVKPVALVMDALLDCSHRKGLVLDPFGGAGTTLIAAEKTGRRARLLELDPGYVDVTIRRWERLTGEEARHAATGMSFAELAASRLNVPEGTIASQPEVRHD